MAKKKADVAKKKYLCMKDGAEHPVIREDGRYYYTAETQFRKTNRDILKVDVRLKEIEAAAETAKDEEVIEDVND